MYAYKSTQLSGLLCLWQCFLGSIQHFIAWCEKWKILLHLVRKPSEKRATVEMACTELSLLPKLRCFPSSTVLQPTVYTMRGSIGTKHLSSYYVLSCDFPTQRLHDIRDLGTFGKRSKLKSKFLKWSTLILAINYFVTMMMMRTVQGNKKYGRILNMRRLTLSLSTRQYIWHKEQAFDVVISVMVSKMTEWLQLFVKNCGVY